MVKVIALCSECAKNPNIYLNGVTVERVNKDKCPNCRTNALTRLASVTWLMTLFGGAVSILLYYSWSVKAAAAFGFTEDLCTFVWILAFILVMWSSSTAAGKYIYKKFKIMEEIYGDYEMKEEEEI